MKAKVACSPHGQGTLSVRAVTVFLDVFLLEAEVSGRAGRASSSMSSGTCAAVALETTTIRPMASGTVQMAGCSQRMRSSGCSAQNPFSGAKPAKILPIGLVEREGAEVRQRGGPRAHRPRSACRCRTFHRHAAPPHAHEQEREIARAAMAKAWPTMKLISSGSTKQPSRWPRRR